MIRVAGIGNEFRGDDGVGPFVAALVQKTVRLKFVSGVVCHTYSDSVLDLMGVWSPGETVILVDAVMSVPAKLPGEVVRYDIFEKPPKSDSLRFSSHAFDPLQVAQFAAELGRKPGRLLLYAIEGRDFAYGRGLSPVVEKAAHDVAREIFEEFCWGNIEICF